jgi:hypothetical protein
LNAITVRSVRDVIPKAVRNSCTVRNAGEIKGAPKIGCLAITIPILLRRPQSIANHSAVELAISCSIVPYIVRLAVAACWERRCCN